jgi:mannose-6-phosphate isomerase-like protein (cupin superfamily)
MVNLPEFDKSKFINNPFVLKVEKPWGYELILTPSDLPYTGKILHINAGQRLSLQIHDAKQETGLLWSGKANLIIENINGEMETIEMQAGQGYTIKIGQRHRYQAITDCDIFEASTPEIGTTYRLEDDYQRPDETPELRQAERN